jgi:hypothetical protein
MVQTKGQQSGGDSVSGSKEELSGVDVHHPTWKAIDWGDVALRYGFCRVRAQHAQHNGD